MQFNLWKKFFMTLPFAFTLCVLAKNLNFTMYFFFYFYLNLGLKGNVVMVELKYFLAEVKLIEMNVFGVFSKNFTFHLQLWIRFWSFCWVEFLISCIYNLGEKKFCELAKEVTIDTHLTILCEIGSVWKFLFG